MKINEHIYFASGVLLKDLDIKDKNVLINAFEVRVKGYYLRPIKILNKLRNAFSVAIIEFSMIDALARYSTISDKVGERMKELLIVNFGVNTEIADKAYEDFRNGLLHENHIKNCGQLCYETNSSFELHNGCLIVNPLKFQRELDKYFMYYIDLLRRENKVYDIFINRIARDFAHEVDFFKKTT